MFNKKWLEVLVPQVGMVMITLGVFFLCRVFGMEDKDTVVEVATGIVVGTCIVAFVADVKFVVVATCIVAFAAVALAAANFVALAAAFAFVAIFPTALATVLVTKDYRLPKLWVVVSFFAEAAAISLPIYFTIN